MKKILTMLLVAVIGVSLLPLATSAASSNSTVLGFSTQDVVDDSNIRDFGQIPLGTDVTVLEIPLKIENFHYSDDVVDDIQFTEDIKNRMWFEYIPANGTSAKFEDLFAPIDEKHHISPVQSPRFVFTAKNIGRIDGDLILHYKPDPSKPTPLFTESIRYHIEGEFLDPTNDKRIIDLSGLNMATEAKYVAHNGKIIWTYDMRDNDPSKDPKNLSAHQQQLVDMLNSLEISPGDNLSFGLHTDLFIWNPDVDKMRSSVRKSTLENDHVRALKLLIAGNDFIDSVQFENRDHQTASYVVRFKEDFPIVEEKDFTYELSLGMRGVRNRDTVVRIGGVFKNDEQFVNSNHDYIFSGDGVVIEPDETVNNIRVDIGNGVTLVADLHQGKRYFGTTSLELSKDDKDIMNYYLSIKKAISVKTTNLEPRTRYVLLDEKVSYFVYDADGLYIGMSHEKLPYRTKYYLSTQRLGEKIETEIEDAPEELIGDGENPPTGGNETYSVGNVIGFVSLLAGGILLYNRKKSVSLEQEEQ